MQCLEVSGGVRPLYGSVGVKGLINSVNHLSFLQNTDSLSSTWCCVDSPSIHQQLAIRHAGGNFCYPTGAAYRMTAC